jgi:hypothetical protein
MNAHSKKVVVRGGGSDSVYGLGMIGAWVYYIGRANTPRLRVLGFLKGLVWPAMLVYEILKFLNDDLPKARSLASSQPAPTLQQAPAGKPAVAAKARSARKPVKGAKPKTKKAVRK